MNEDATFNLDKYQRRILVTIIEYIQKHQPKNIQEHTLNVLKRINESGRYSQDEGELLSVLNIWYKQNR